jgi:hypothetical protein
MGDLRGMRDLCRTFGGLSTRRIPVYWIIKAPRGIVLVCDNPQGTGADSHYARTQQFAGDDEIPIVIDGHEVGRIAANRLFPRPMPGA